MKIKDLKITNVKPLDAGGQGEVMSGELAHAPGEKYAIKLIERNQQLIDRTTAICANNLCRLSPYIAAPFAFDVTKKSVRHIANFADGHAIDEGHPRTFPESLEVITAAVTQLAMLEERGIAHCDLGPDNVRINQQGEAFIIDLDGSRIPGTAAASAVVKGKYPMMAPEVRNNNQPPDQYSDRFAFSVLASWVLFNRHPVSEINITPKRFGQLMSNGRWPERNNPQDGSTYPLRVLNAELLHLFDRGFLLNPYQRPSLEEWRLALFNALHSMRLHSCGQVFVDDGYQHECPFCRVLLQRDLTQRTLIKLRLPDHGIKMKTELTEGNEIILGRANLPGVGGTVSGRHLTLSSENGLVFVKQIGRNATQMIDGDHQITLSKAVVSQQLDLQLPDGSHLTISVG